MCVCVCVCLYLFTSLTYDVRPTYVRHAHLQHDPHLQDPLRLFLPFIFQLVLSMQMSVLAHLFLCLYASIGYLSALYDWLSLSLFSLH